MKTVSGKIAFGNREGNDEKSLVVVTNNRSGIDIIKFGTFGESLEQRVQKLT